MNRKSLGSMGWLLLALCAVLPGGCVERRYTVLTDPPGAFVLENGKPIGNTTVDRPFIYYGKYRFTLMADGYQTLVVDECIKAPWYEWFLLDFVSENLIPWTIRDVRTFKYDLKRLEIIPPEIVKARADEMRARGQAIGEPLPPPPVAIPPGAIVPAVPGAVPGQVAPPIEVAPPPGRLVQPTSQTTPPAPPNAAAATVPQQPPATPVWTPSGK
jgi:hypothetical protein